MTRSYACVLAGSLAACTSAPSEPTRPAAPVPSAPAAPSSEVAPGDLVHGDDAPHAPSGAGMIGLDPRVSIGCPPPRLGSEHVSAALEALRVVGQRSEELVRRVVLRQLVHMAGCYEPVRGSLGVPTARFTGQLRFTQRGQVAEVTLDPLDPELAHGAPCLRRRLRAVILPAEEPALGPALVTLRVRLGPRPEGGLAPVECGHILP